MTRGTQNLSEEFVRLALAIDEHQPGYIDSYFGPREWAEEAKQNGKLPLSDLARRVDDLAAALNQLDDVEAQRKDFLVHQVSAMQMSLRLLAGERVSLAEEVEGLYDVQPTWKAESIFLEAQRQLDQILPKGDSLKERMEAWDKSLEIPVEKVKELFPFIVNRLRELTRAKFDLPEEESFNVEFVSNQPWRAYNWYLGGYKSRIEVNTDLPTHVNWLAGLMAHEGYPGHHTELSTKELKLIRQRNFQEHALVLINSPSCVISEGIATTALETILSDDELESWYREEILPRAGMSHIDVARVREVSEATRKRSGLGGNAAFMLHDQNKSTDEIRAYLQQYGLASEKDAEQSINFISNPIYRSYIFTYHVGKELLDELFASKDRDTYFRRILEEPVTPSQIRQWIAG